VFLFVGCSLCSTWYFCVLPGSNAKLWSGETVQKPSRDSDFFVTAAVFW
jgi:hypothetical protein